MTANKTDNCCSHMCHTGNKIRGLELHRLPSMQYLEL